MDTKNNAAGVPEGWRRESLEATAKRLRCAVKYNESMHPGDILEVVEFAERCLAAAPTAAAGQEVAAYQVRSPRTGKARFMNKSKKHLIDHWQMSGYEVRPLVYGDAAPAEAKPVAAAAEPVTFSWRNSSSNAPLYGSINGAVPPFFRWPAVKFAAPAAPVEVLTDERAIFDVLYAMRLAPRHQLEDAARRIAALTTQTKTENSNGK